MFCIGSFPCFKLVITSCVNFTLLTIYRKIFCIFTTAYCDINLLKISFLCKKTKHIYVVFILPTLCMFSHNSLCSSLKFSNNFLLLFVVH